MWTSIVDIIVVICYMSVTRNRIIKSYFVFHINCSLTIHTTKVVSQKCAKKPAKVVTITKSIVNIVETVSSVKTVSSSNVVKTLPDNRRKQG